MLPEYCGTVSSTMTNKICLISPSKLDLQVRYSNLKIWQVDCISGIFIIICTDINDRGASKAFVILGMDPSQKISNNFTVDFYLAKCLRTGEREILSLRHKKVYFLFGTFFFFCSLLGSFK